MTSLNFARALGFTLSFEGGWSDNPRDPGGATMRGVTLNTYRLYHPRATATQLRNAPMSDFQAIYRQDFWAKIGGDGLPSGVDLLAFDIAVNMGPGRARAWIAATAHLGAQERIHRLDELRLGFWRHLTREWRVFGRGWCRRENACLKTALALAGA